MGNHPGNMATFEIEEVAMLRDTYGRETDFERMDIENQNNNHDSKNEHLLKSGQLGMFNDPYCTTCPTYFKASQQRYPKFNNSLGDAKGFGRKLLSFCSSCVPGVMYPHNDIVQQWNQFLTIVCLFATYVDPSFFFLIYVKEDYKCIVINWEMTKTLVVVRSITDFVYFLNILHQFRLAYISPKSRVVVDHPRKIALNYLKSYFLLDIFVVLPIPQIIMYFVLPRFLGLSGANYAKNLLRAAILIQYLPRLFRFLPLLIGQSSTQFKSAWASFVMKPLIFMLSGHVVGSCWYLFGLQRVNQCFRDACHRSHLPKCMKLIDCDPKVHDISPLWSKNNGSIACLNSTSGAFSYGSCTTYDRN